MNTSQPIADFKNFLKEVSQNKNKIILNKKITYFDLKFEIVAAEELNEMTKQIKSYVQDQDISARLKIDFDTDKIIAFAKNSSFGCLFNVVFMDEMGKIYHCDIDNGKEPFVKCVSEDYKTYLDFNSLLKKNANNKNQIIEIGEFVKLGDLISPDNYKFIEIHGFLDDSYEPVVNDIHNKLFGESLLTDFVREKLSDQIISLNFTIKGKPISIQINNSKWFDFSFASKLNIYLKELSFKYGMYVIHDIGWDEMHAVTFLDEKLFKKLKKENFIVEV
jgi:hypothetical protein